MSEHASHDLANGIHLVGSIPLSSNTETFRKAMTTLPHRLRRLPDGETGKRHYFTLCQDHVFIRSPFIMYPHDLVGTPFEGQDVSVPEGAEIELAPTGYDDAASDSYKVFVQLRNEGVVEPGVRFQVCIPTLVNVLSKWVRPAYQAEAEPVYEALLLKAMRRIQDTIPSEDLAMQFDRAVEFAMLEGVGRIFTPWFTPVKEGLMERILRLVGAIDDEVELGFRLCYGNSKNQHLIQPKDSAHLVDMANSLTREVTGPIHWIHMPVPKDRTDAAYFEPMKSLILRNETELYLGLIHANDLEGTLQRIGAARKVVSKDFGVGPVCGLGRTPTDDLDGMLEISAAVARPVHLGD